MTYITNKTNVHHIFDTWNLDVLGLLDYGTEINRCSGQNLVMIIKLSKIGQTVLSKTKTSQTTTFFLKKPC